MSDLNNSVERFSDRVENYIKYRPDYPFEIIEFLKKEIDLTSDKVIADIGSGTGLSALNFLKNGNQVIGIEPNEEMRKAGEIFLKEYSKFSSQYGKSDNTNLPDNSIDLIIAGQAFHWFDVDKTKNEFKRILKGDRYVLLIWNEKNFSKLFMSDYEKLLKTYGTDYDKVKQENIDDSILSNFFDKGYQLKEFYNNQIFDYQGVEGRMLSSSYIPLDATIRETITNELKNIFNKYQSDNKIDFEYTTKVYYGKI